MACRRSRIALFVALALGPGGVRAQFQPVVMKLGAWPSSTVAGGSWTAGSGPDLLLLQGAGTGQGRLYAHQNLLEELSSPYAAPATSYAAAVGAFEGDPATTLPDVAWSPSSTFDLAVTWGESPTTLTTFSSVFAHWPDGMAAVRLLPRPQPVLLVTGGKAGANAASDLYAVDLAASRGPPPVTPASLPPWPVPAYWPAQDGDTFDRIHPLRLSPAARGAGLEDAIVPFRMGFLLVWHDSVPSDATLASLDASVKAVPFGATTPALLAPFLPGDLASRFGAGSCLGAAAIDVDGGNPDLVFSYSDVRWNTFWDPPMPGELLWISNGGDVAAMASQKPWGRLSGRADLAAITDAGTLRQLDLDSGEAAFAVQDRARERIVIVRGDGVSGFTTAELPTAGAYVQELTTLDVVGSPAKDLLALVQLPPAFTTWELWVYPDAGDAAPSLRWSPEPPGTVPLGQDLTLSVDASDPDAPPLSLTWLGLPGGAVNDVQSATVDGGLLCQDAASLDVTVRAMDALGVYVTVEKQLTVAARPALWLAGAAAAGPLVLAPGGASGRAEGDAWPACATGAATYAFGQVGLTGAVFAPCAAPGVAPACTDFTIPETAYPEALSAPPALTLEASGPTSAGIASGTATLPLALDARGLVAAAVAFDRTSLEAGELGLARVRLASRIGVPLPAVRVLVRLDALTFAGPMIVRGASGTPGAEEGEILIDALPARDSGVEIQVPVRSVGLPGSVSVELFSAGGVRVSPEASPPSVDARSPGCGCTAGAGGALAPGLLVLLALGRRRRPR